MAADVSGFFISLFLHNVFHKLLFELKIENKDLGFMVIVTGENVILFECTLNPVLRPGPLIPAVKVGWRPENQEFKVSLGYLVSLLPSWRA